MKYLFTLSFIAFLYGSVIAQSHITKPDSGKVMLNCGCGHTISQPPLYLLRSHGKQYVIDSLGIDPQIIAAINIVKDSTEYMKYGAAARYGTVIITINDQKFPRALHDYKGKIKEISMH